MSLDGLRQALMLSLAARDAALAGDLDQVDALLDARTPYLNVRGLPASDTDSARAILTQIQRLDTDTEDALLRLRRVLEEERAELRRAAHLRAAYRPRLVSSHLDRRG
ncbi:MAG: hypothetical protein RMM58_15790 [Chloroflexota bacterium]|nr:hypothetical protein [Dehalococcoidia bacterium]MDW8255334.1 hypothetical protein [Chloroflexota bacterium]